MTLIEAIKSGKPFRRKGSADAQWFTPFEYSVCGNFMYRDILADDYEIDEPKVTVTRGQVEAAIRTADSAYDREVSEWDRSLYRALGLEP